MKILLGLILLMPGILLLLAYRCVVARLFPDFALGLYAEHQTIAGIIATFSFTMLGFLATIIVFMFGFYESKPFLRYRQRGHFDCFKFFYLGSVLSLMLTFLFSLISYTNLANIGGCFFSLMLANACNNIVQIFLIAFAVLKMAEKSLKEERA